MVSVEQWLVRTDVARDIWFRLPADTNLSIELAIINIHKGLSLYGLFHNI